MAKTHTQLSPQVYPPSSLLPYRVATPEEMGFAYSDRNPGRADLIVMKSISTGFPSLMVSRSSSGIRLFARNSFPILENQDVPCLFPTFLGFTSPFSAPSPLDVLIKRNKMCFYRI